MLTVGLGSCPAGVAGTLRTEPCEECSEESELTFALGTGWDKRDRGSPGKASNSTLGCHCGGQPLASRPQALQRVFLAANVVRSPKL